MSDLFNRDATFIVGSVKIPIRSKSPPGVVVPNLRVTFSIDKTDNRAPNKATVAVYNLNETHRKTIAERQPISIQAGYVGSTSLLFSGTISKGGVKTVKDRVDWVSTFESGDGAKEYQTARLNKSYGPGTPTIVVVQDLVNALGVGIGNVKQKMNTAQTRKNIKEFKKGFVVAGQVSNSLNKVFTALGFQWSIQDEQVQILLPGEATIESVVVLNPSSGLIGSPEVSEKGVVRFRSLLQGKIKPGRRVKIESRSANGLFKVQKVHHLGDTWGADWYTDGEGKAVS